MNALACIGLLCLVASVRSQRASWSELTKQNEFEQMEPTKHLPTRTGSFCNNGTCAGVPYEKILNLYGGLLL